MSKPIHANRLAGEKSPYLLQHAHNPVDWYPWGPEAFEKARKEDKPIFLSIGYSTCHWCHVMEKESFEDAETADLLNRHFVAIKVDREERPDVDALYMQAVMAMAGQGGWPMSVFLTPDLHPFYGGTYFPPEDRWGHPGFKSVLRGAAQAWATRREEILASGRAMVETLQAGGEKGEPAAAELSEKTLARAFESFAAAYDETYGGFEPAPKFPRSHALSFLLRWWKRSGDADALKIVEHTLKRMAAGGMYDHLGGGFHRYSTDAEWLVPHFEKMLYDQALLATTYLEAYQATGNKEYARVAREIFDYVLRDMTGPDGGFLSAEDADSLPAGGQEKKEGAFYVWTQEELAQILGPERAKTFGAVYGVRPDGNVAHDPQGELAGQNILHEVRGSKEDLSAAEKELFDARARRPRPHLDDKVLTDWNGLMISALALGAQVLEEPRYLQAAHRAAGFIRERLVTPQGRLLHRWRDGDAAIPGTLEDYAFLIHGLVELYQAGFDPAHLAEATRLTGEMLRLFWDEGKGGFYLTGTDAEKLLARQMELYDGAVPSGNSVAALDLIRVARLTADPEPEAKAAKLMERFGGQVERAPSAFPQLLIALDFALGPSKEIVVTGPREDPAAREMLRTLRRKFLPNKVVSFQPKAGPAAATVCENHACQLPVASAAELEFLLDGK